MQGSHQEFLESLARVLLRCWVLGFVLLFISLGAMMLAADFSYRLQGNLFGVTKHELELIFYCGLGLLKLLVLVFFFIPWLSIRFVLRMK
jgi:hypothetical protein